MKQAILNNPVRIYSIVSACLALAAYYVESLPVPLLLSLLAAVLGVGGEVTRNHVMPVHKLAEPNHNADLLPAAAG